MAKRQDQKPQDEVNKEFEEKVLYINRCAKVVKGGRKFSFSALILVGDMKGRVGFGFAKANEVADAIKKATQQARKSVFTFAMDGTTIPHEVHISFHGAKLLLKPAHTGTGIIAGSKVRAMLELAGVKDIVAKSLGSSNPLNLVYATVKALKSLKTREECFQERGI